MAGHEIIMHAQLREVSKKDGSKKRMFVAMVGIRGDWPWQRAADAIKLWECDHHSFACFCNNGIQVRS